MARSENGPPRPMSRLVLIVLRGLLRLRYRVEVRGGDQLRNTDGGWLVLPNHPAYVDPALVLCHLPGRLSVRPLVYTDTYRHAVLRPLMRPLRALEVPELRREPRQARTLAVRLIDDVVAGLGADDCFLIYPSGRLQRSGHEWVGPARAVHEIVREAPENTQVALVRSRGVWGSSFSCAATGEVPPLTGTLIRSVVRAVLAGVCCMPRRRVELTIETVPVQTFNQLSRREFNAWLESWYNADGGEVISQVPYHPWSHRRTKLHQKLPRRRSAQTALESSTDNLMLQPAGWRARTATASRRWRRAARKRLRRIGARRRNSRR